jgi:formylglycine-generating enzyme required for sulfatase activity
MIDAGGFLIDAFEVTREAYATFVGDAVDPAGQSQVCTWNDAFDPIEDDPDAGCDGAYDFSLSTFPITCVDWCDAAAYCAWAGKRMCGRVGGGTVPSDETNDATRSEWYAACSEGGTKTFPYGSTEDGGACNTLGNGAEVLAVHSFPDCMGGYDGIFDMVGNAEEWEDACDLSSDPATDNCALRGGAFWANATEPDRDYAICTFNGERKPDRSNASHDWSFRCCADP